MAFVLTILIFHLLEHAFNVPKSNCSKDETFFPFDEDLSNVVLRKTLCRQSVDFDHSERRFMKLFEQNF